jgi:LPS export ABC transporter protein LptC
MPRPESGRSAATASPARGAARALARVFLAGCLLAGAAVLALDSCSLAGLASQVAAKEEELPTAVFSDYSHTVVVRGKKNFVLKATRAELYETSKRTLLSGVTFSEYDPDTGELLSLGKADEAVYHTDTKDAEFSGSVLLESRKQDAVLQGEFLRWIDKDKRLEGRLDRTVTISRADGSRVSGAGFEADTRRRAFSFRESVEGRIESKPGPGPEAQPKAEPESEARPEANPL